MPALLTNEAATGAGVQIPKGKYAFSATGTFGGATLTLQRLMNAPAATWLAVGAEATLTADGQCLCELPGAVYRVLVAGGAPANLYAALDPSE